MTLLYDCSYCDMTVVVDDDEAIDAASHVASEAYRQSSPQKTQAVKLSKV